MPIIKSAKKRVKVATKATIRNSKTKRSLKAAVKAFGQALKSTDKKQAITALDKVQSELDKAAKKGVIHRNKAARKKSQAARAAKAAGTPTAAKAKPTKSTTSASKKPAPTKAAAKPKKTAAKKTAAKKTTVSKKPAAKAAKTK